jgi:hypothetical protein
MLELTTRSVLQIITENILFVCTLRRLMVFALWMLGACNTIRSNPTDLIPA